MWDYKVVAVSICSIRAAGVYVRVYDRENALMCLRRNEDINYLHMFPERAGVCVGLVAHFADVWLV